MNSKVVALLQVVVLVLEYKVVEVNLALIQIVKLKLNDHKISVLGQYGIMMYLDVVLMVQMIHGE